MEIKIFDCFTKWPASLHAAVGINHVAQQANLAPMDWCAILSTFALLLTSQLLLAILLRTTRNHLGLPLLLAVSPW